MKTQNNKRKAKTGDDGTSVVKTTSGIMTQVKGGLWSFLCIAVSIFAYNAKAVAQKQPFVVFLTQNHKSDRKKTPDESDVLQKP